MTDLGHDISLIHDELLFFVFGDKGLADDFHGVEEAVFFEADKKYFGKASWANAFVNLKWI